MIPEDWSVEMLQEFLIRSLRRSLDDYNESQIVLGLGRGENLMVNAKYYIYVHLYTNRSFFETYCPKLLFLKTIGEQ
jgi:hypothetical protein